MLTKMKGKSDMDGSRSYRVAMALLMCAVSRPAGAEDYWAYTYKDFDVTTVGSREHAVSLAHDIARFDTAVSRVLQLPDTRVPTHIYELPGGQVKQLLGAEDVATFHFSGYEVSVISSSEGGPGNRYWGSLFGYVGGLLESGRAPRYPYWFQVGVPELFAQTEFDNDRIKTGGVVFGYAQTLQRGKLIPMRTFLSLRDNDPQLKVAEYRAMYDAESWYLAREVYVEGKLRPEFGQYLGSMRDGKSEAEAFSASFKIGYEELDKLLVEAMREPTHVFVVQVPREPADHDLPLRLSTAEIKGRMAELSLQDQHRDDALRLATEALQLDANNEAALRVLARASLQAGNFDAALAAVDKLGALSASSAAALTDSGDVLSHLARAVTKKQASIGVGADALIHRAIEAYEHAVTLDREYLRAWAGLAYLYASQRDVQAAKAFLPRAEPVLEKNIRSAALARALATMCAQTGQADGAFRFGEYWRDDALTKADLDQALAFGAWLKAHPLGTGSAQSAQETTR